MGGKSLLLTRVFACFRTTSNSMGVQTQFALNYRIAMAIVEVVATQLFVTPHNHRTKTHVSKSLFLYKQIQSDKMNEANT
jgi:hypothetical protein